MKEKLLIQGESLQKPVGKTLAAELFLNTRYHLRRNVLNGKLEFAPKTADEPSFRPLTQLALNSIILQAKREAICGDENPKSDIVEYVNSEDVIPYNPIQEYLNDLPQWDGQNHVAALFNRIPGVTSEQALFLECLVSFCRSPLAPDGPSSRQRVCAYFNRCSGLWQNHLPASHAASSSASVLSRSSQSLQQVRQGDGSDKQSAGQPR